MVCAGAVVRYRWYKWRYQPTLVQMAEEFPDKYTDDYLNSMQTKIEHMQTEWLQASSTQNFLKKPSKLKHKAELERVLFVDPPASVPSVGWVPVALSETYEGKWAEQATDAGFAWRGGSGY